MEYLSHISLAFCARQSPPSLPLLPLSPIVLLEIASGLWALDQPKQRFDSLLPREHSLNPLLLLLCNLQVCGKWRVDSSGRQITAQSFNIRVL